MSIERAFYCNSVAGLYARASLTIKVIMLVSDKGGGLRVPHCVLAGLVPAKVSGGTTVTKILRPVFVWHG